MLLRCGPNRLPNYFVKFNKSVTADCCTCAELKTRATEQRLLNQAQNRIHPLSFNGIDDRFII